MIKQENLDEALIRLGLNVPEAERLEIAYGMKLMEEMKAAIRKPRSLKSEPAFTPLLPEE